MNKFLGGRGGEKQTPFFRKENLFWATGDDEAKTFFTTIWDKQREVPQKDVMFFPDTFKSWDSFETIPEPIQDQHLEALIKIRKAQGLQPCTDEIMRELKVITTPVSAFLGYFLLCHT